MIRRNRRRSGGRKGRWNIGYELYRLSNEYAAISEARAERKENPKTSFACGGMCGMQGRIKGAVPCDGGNETSGIWQDIPFGRGF